MSAIKEYLDRNGVEALWGKVKGLIENKISDYLKKADYKELFKSVTENGAVVIARNPDNLSQYAAGDSVLIIGHSSGPVNITDCVPTGVTPLNAWLKTNGSPGNFAFGNGNYSLVAGHDCFTNDLFSHAEGYHTMAGGMASHSEGYCAFAMEDYSHAEGYYTFAKGMGSHAEGYGWSTNIDLTVYNTINSLGATTGLKNFWKTFNAPLIAAGYYSHAEGYCTLALGDNSHTEGYCTCAASDYSHAEGNGSHAEGIGSHAEGLLNIAFGNYSHAEGNYSHAEGNYSHAEGNYSHAEGNYSHAEGYYSCANGNFSHAEGCYTYASGVYSHAEGNYTETHNDSEHACGRYNASTESNDASQATHFSIGIGTSDTNRKNAFEVKQNGDIYVDGVEGRIQDKLNIDFLVPIEHNDLKKLRNNNQLIPGQKYRIIDYVTITTQTDTTSAWNLFDVIVTALDDHTLSENASAVRSSRDGDNYFGTENLEAWQLKYCLDNDTERFAWADNSAVQWYSRIVANYIVDQSGTHTYSLDKESYIYDYNSAPHPDTGEDTLVFYAQDPMYFNEDDGADYFDAYFYNGITTVDGIEYDSWKKYDNDFCEWVNSYDAEGLFALTERIVYNGEFVWPDKTGVENGKGVIYNMIDEYGNECPYDFKNIKFYYDGLGTDVYTFTWIDENYEVMDASVFGNNGTLTFNGEISGVYGNVIKPYIVEIYNEYSGDYIGTKQLLNNITFISDYEFEGIGNDGFYGCNSNSFGNDCYNNSFSNNCYSNSFGNSCNYNSFGNSYNKNSFGNNCYRNSFDYSCYGNSFGNYCSYNSFGYSCYNNSFGNNCYRNSFDYSFYGNSFGNSCNNNSFGYSCYGNSFDNYCNNNSFGNNCYRNSFDNYCSYNSFGNGCYCNIFGNSCDSNSFDYSCYYNRFDNSCDSNSFGYSCYNNSFGNKCNSNIFGNSCDSNSFGNKCGSNSFGNGCSSNSFGNGCYCNSFRASSSKTGTILSYCYYNHFDDGCSYNVIWNSTQPTSSNKLQNINVVRGVSGTLSNYNFINIVDKNKAYEIKVAKNSSGVIKIYCEADLI